MKNTMMSLKDVQHLRDNVKGTPTELVFTDLIYTIETLYMERDKALVEVDRLERSLLRLLNEETGKGE